MRILKSILVCGLFLIALKKLYAPVVREPLGRGEVNLPTAFTQPTRAELREIQRQHQEFDTLQKKYTSQLQQAFAEETNLNDMIAEKQKALETTRSNMQKYVGASDQESVYKLKLYKNAENTLTAEITDLKRLNSLSFNLNRSPFTESAKLEREVELPGPALYFPSLEKTWDVVTQAQKKVREAGLTEPKDLLVTQLQTNYAIFENILKQEIEKDIAAVESYRKEVVEAIKQQYGTGKFAQDLSGELDTVQAIDTVIAKIDPNDSRYTLLRNRLNLLRLVTLNLPHEKSSAGPPVIYPPRIKIPTIFEPNYTLPRKEILEADTESARKFKVRYAESVKKYLTELLKVKEKLLEINEPEDISDEQVFKQYLLELQKELSKKDITQERIKEIRIIRAHIEKLQKAYPLLQKVPGIEKSYIK